KNEIPYTIENLNESLKIFAGNEFSDTFFNKYIYKSEMPDYKNLMAAVGVSLSQNLKVPYFGASVAINNDLNGEIKSYPIIGSPAYSAGLTDGDIITRINNMPFPNGISFTNFIKTLKVGDTLDIDFTRFGVPKKTTVTLASSPEYTIELNEKSGGKVLKKILEKRNQWLKNE
ncbi:MAG: PDZ domain-containing protein, partial [Cellulophaga sp.]|nr:PDZ domain-containing protein [Cellulophaga sp.]